MFDFVVIRNEKTVSIKFNKGHYILPFTESTIDGVNIEIGTNKNDSKITENEIVINEKWVSANYLNEFIAKKKYNKILNIIGQFKKMLITAVSDNTKYNLLIDEYNII